jgi:hypothetical protein
MSLVRVFVGDRGSEESAAPLAEVVEQIKRRLRETPCESEVVVLKNMAGIEVAAYDSAGGLDWALSRRLEPLVDEWAWEAVAAASWRSDPCARMGRRPCFGRRGRVHRASSHRGAHGGRRHSGP